MFPMTAFRRQKIHQELDSFAAQNFSYLQNSGTLIWLHLKIINRILVLLETHTPSVITNNTVITKRRSVFLCPRPNWRTLFLL